MGLKCTLVCRKLEELIEKQLPTLHTLHSPVLEIEARLYEVQDGSASELLERKHLITIDLRRWCANNDHGFEKQDQRPRKDTQQHSRLEILAEVARDCSPERNNFQDPDPPQSNLPKASRRPAMPDTPDTLPDGSEAATSSSSTRQHKRRKLTIQTGTKSQLTPPQSPPATAKSSTRQLCTHGNTVPQRKKPNLEQVRAFRPSTLDKLIIGIWETLYGSVQLALPTNLPEFQEIEFSQSPQLELRDGSVDSFRTICALCQRVSHTSRSFRALEIIIQAHWVECFDARVAALNEESKGSVSMSSSRKAALMEACQDLLWSEKELRNRMAIWRGYWEIKEVAGWAALVFAAAGIYRYCKYRVAFDTASMSKLARLRSRFEVAADTLQPQWRELLTVIGQHCRRVYHGHPHDWTVSNSADPVPLAWTYRECDPDFSYKHIETPVLDEAAWSTSDPRKIKGEPPYICTLCQQRQSQNVKENQCECFPNLYTEHGAYPVQVFRTEDGRNNGLLACCAFERGTVVGEFVGEVTSGKSKVDVFTGQVGSNPTYQIFQGRMGNHTRFVNHSCLPNCQYQSFSWLGIERILLVSKGIPAGSEITVDYSGRYWQGLGKYCRCGQSCCQYKQNGARSR